jgi:hypothetical protein
VDHKFHENKINAQNQSGTSAQRISIGLQLAMLHCLNADCLAWKATDVLQYESLMHVLAMPASKKRTHSPSFGPVKIKSSIN